MRRHARRLLPAAAGLLVASCDPPEPPGEPLGEFDVRATLEENTCGPLAVIAGDSEYAVELRRDERAGYWKLLGGRRLVGRFGNDEILRVELQSYIQLYGPEYEREARLDEPEDFFTLTPRELDPNDAKGCVLVQAEKLEIAVDAEATDGGSRADLAGSHHLHLSSAPDARCALALEAEGGPFETLPCDIHYTVQGERRPGSREVVGKSRRPTRRR